MLRSQRTNILYHNHTLIFALMRSSVAETVPTQHVREVDHQLTRVLRTISSTLVATIPLPLIQVLVYTIAQPQIRRRERHFEGIRSQRPQRDLYMLVVRSAPIHLLRYVGRLRSWWNQHLRLASQLVQYKFMGYLSGQVCIVWSDVLRKFLEWSVSFIRTVIVKVDLALSRLSYRSGQLI